MKFLLTFLSFLLFFSGCNFFPNSSTDEGNSDSRLQSSNHAQKEPSEQISKEELSKIEETISKLEAKGEEYQEFDKIADNILEEIKEKPNAVAILLKETGSFNNSIFDTLIMHNNGDAGSKKQMAQMLEIFSKDKKINKLTTKQLGWWLSSEMEPETTKGIIQNLGEENLFNLCVEEFKNDPSNDLTLTSAVVKKTPLSQKLFERLDKIETNESFTEEEKLNRLYGLGKLLTTQEVEKLSAYRLSKDYRVSFIFSEYFGNEENPITEKVMETVMAKPINKDILKDLFELAKMKDNFYNFSENMKKCVEALDKIETFYDKSRTTSSKIRLQNDSELITLLNNEFCSKNFNERLKQYFKNWYDF